MSDIQETNLNDQRRAMAALFKEREAVGITTRDLEKQSGVSFNAVSTWRHGLCAPTLDKFIALAETLGFEVVLRRKQEQ